LCTIVSLTFVQARRDGSSTRLSAIVKVKQIRPITATLSRPSAALSGNLAYGLSDLPETDDVKDENHR